MFSLTRTALEQFDNQHDFERMAADILNALGYREVVPIAPRGGSDGGRDITFTTESGGKGLACVTLRQDIEVKFRQDFSQRTIGEYEKYTFFCTAYLTAKQKVTFSSFCINTLQAEFVPYDIEALRSLLDTPLKAIRETYLHIKNDTIGVKEEDLIKYQEEMQKQREADRLLLEADKFVSSLMEKEELVKRAVELHPPYKQRELRQLGIEISVAVIDGYDPVTQRSLMMAGLGRGMAGYRRLERKQLPVLAAGAITYLRENVVEATTPDAEGLLYLACMYGYQQQFEDMIRTIGQAVKINGEIKEQFQQRKILQTLLRTCDSEQTKWERLRESLDLPHVSKKSFCEFLQAVDLTNLNRFIEWTALKRPNTPGERGPFLIQITPPYPSNDGKVSASAQSIESWASETVVSNAEPGTIEKLYDALHSSFILFCSIG